MLCSALLASVCVASLPASPERPPLVSRVDWGAKHVGPNAKTHRIKYITVHHGGVASNATRSLEDKLRGLQAWSQREDKLASGKTKPAWPDIPYHYYIAIDGRIGEARPAGIVGDTNTEYDPAGHLLIVLEGNFETEKPPAKQLESLRALTVWCAWRWNVPATRIAGHKDYAKTSCPGANLYPEIEGLRRLVRAASWERASGP